MDNVKKTRKKAVELQLDDMLQWYAIASGGKLPQCVCEDTKSYRGKVLRWLEPLLPIVENPVLIEEFIGDSWTLRLEPCQRKITNLK